MAFEDKLIISLEQILFQTRDIATRQNISILVNNVILYGKESKQKFSNHESTCDLDRH